MNSLVIDKLSVAYGAKEVLHDVSLTIEQGTVVGLIGPNGAGKTTLLRAAAGLIPALGEIRYGERALASLSARERAVYRAYVPQLTDAVFPFRVNDIVAMGLAHQSRWYGTPHDSMRVQNALSEVGFTAGSEKRVDCLSGGERQQVMIARALVQGASLFFLDEPASALDLRHRARTLAALRRRARAGASILISLHDLNLAAAACDRVFLLDQGRIAASGTPAEVIRPETIREVYGVAVVCGRHPSLPVPTVELDPEAWA